MFNPVAHISVCLAAASGVVLIVAILHDAFEVMLLPRRIKSKTRIVRYFFAATWTTWKTLSRLLPDTAASNVLGLYGPLSLIALLMVWAAGLIVAFGCLFWGLNSAELHPHRLLNQIYFSGVTFFTLGYGDLVPHTVWSKMLSVVEAGTGLGFIAMVIGYLPVMYQLFSRREAQVIMLDAVAGSPPKAVTMLCRYAEGRSLGNLNDLLLHWQQWSAELLESQLSYPMLAYYRSQHDNQSWLAALTAVMDLSALVMVGLDGVHTFQARLTFATARLAAVELGRVLDVKPRAFDEDRLSSTGFAALKGELAGSEIHFVDEGEAEDRLAAFRSTYEPFLNGLAEHLLLTLPDWAPDPDQVDNWVNTPRGKSAKRLIEALEPVPEAEQRGR